MCIVLVSGGEKKMAKVISGRTQCLVVSEAEHSLLPNSCSAKLSYDSPPNVPQHLGTFDKISLQAGTYLSLQEIQNLLH